MSDSIFGKIARGEVPATIVYEDDTALAFADVNPQAPTHLLVIPRKPIPRLVDASAEDKAILGHLMLAVGDIARQAGVDEAFRVVINNGADVGQTVFHLHLHILGNKTFSEDSLGF